MTTTKLIANYNLNIWKLTCWRTLNRLGYKCRKGSKHIVLTKKHRERRLQCVTQWLTEGHDWIETVFRQIHQCEDGGV